MIPRRAAATLERLAGWYPVVALTGPRQSGKTTLARAAFPDRPYVSLEDLDARDFAAADPRGFLDQYPKGAVIDEAQHVPSLFSYLQTRVDARRRPGEFVLTGSQQFGLTAGISQSLAGRAGLVHLLPLSSGELGAQAPATLEQALLAGGYPVVHVHGVPPSAWYRDYAATYIERDVRQVLAVRDLSAFRRFLRMCAARTAQVLNLSALAADCGITHNTARSWLSILEASYIVFLLPSWHRNLGKRLIKAPKLHFYDTGLAAWLAGVNSEQMLAHGAMRGALFETWVAGEFIKLRCHAALIPELYAFRESNRVEMDLLVEREGAPYPVEAKSGRTLAGDWFAPIERFLEWTGAKEGVLVFGGEARQRRGRVAVFGWRQVEAAAERAYGLAAGA